MVLVYRYRLTSTEMFHRDGRQQLGMEIVRYMHR